MTWTVVPIPGGLVIVGADPLNSLVRGLEAAQREAGARGMPAPSPRWVALLAALRTARDDAAGLPAGAVGAVPTLPAPDPAAPLTADDLVTTKEAALMLGCKPRNVRGLRSLRGQIVAGRLMFARSDVHAELLRRAA